MVLIPASFLVLCIAVVAALIVTLNVSLTNLKSRRPERVPYRWIGFWLWVRSLLVFGLFVVVALTLPHPMIIFALCATAATISTATFWRAKEQSIALNDLVRVVADRGGSIPDAVEAFARDRRGRVGRRAAHFARRLSRGEPVESAAVKSRAPLTAATLLAVQSASTASTPSVSESHPRRLFLSTSSGDLPWRRGPGWMRIHTRPQLGYLAYLILYCLLIGWFFRAWVLPSLEQLGGDFGLVLNPECSWPIRLFTATEFLSTVILWLGGIWICMMLLVRWMPLPWLLRMTPWYGDHVRTESRVLGLKSVAHGVDRGEPVERTLETASRSSPSRWIRRQSGRALAHLRTGTSIAEALRQSRWISRREAVWVRAAERNAQMSEVFHQLSDEIARRYALRWQVRLAWLVPLTVIAAGLFVLAHGCVLFAYMLGAIDALS